MSGRGYWRWTGTDCFGCPATGSSVREQQRCGLKGNGSAVPEGGCGLLDTGSDIPDSAAEEGMGLSNIMVEGSILREPTRILTCCGIPRPDH